MRRVVLWLLAVGLSSSRAFADAPPQDLPASDALFDEAKRLMTAGDFEHACPKLEASLRLASRLGVKLNLADCYEKAGRTASAWAAFREAAGLAARSNDASREAFARQRAAALEPYLAKLAIKIAAADRVPGLTVTRDGVLVDEAVYDTSVPVDPGEHTIQASAAGFQSWSQKLTVVREKAHTIEVPRLAPATAPDKKPTDAATTKVGGEPDPDDDQVDATPGSSNRKLIAYVVGGIGIAALGTSGAFAYAAKSKWHDAASHCDAQNRCDPIGLSINSSARASGNVATITFVAGAAALAAGVVLLVTAPSPHARHERAVAIAPLLTPNAAGLVVGGGF